MKWLNKLERKFGNWAIPGLIKYIVVLNALVYLLIQLDPTRTYVNILTLIPERVWQGEFWRLITYVFIPPNSSPLFIIFVLYFYYMIGTMLEQEWGSFKFNIYYLFGIIGTTAAAFITNGATTSLYLNLSLFLAFAQLFPNFELLLFFILPVKIKYLAWLQWAFLLLTLLTASWDAKVAAVVSVINFLIFFGPDFFSQAKRSNHSYHRRQELRSDNKPKKESFHRCTICGKTEVTDPKMEFRYCAKCTGNHEYCMEHLHNHVHKQE